MPTLQELEEHGLLLPKGIDSVREYAIFTLNPEGIIVTWNQGAEHITGYHAEEVISQSIVRFYKPEVVQQGHVKNILTLASGQAHYVEESWHVRKDGSEFWASEEITAIYDQANQVIGYTQVLHDLTLRKQAELSLRDSEKRYRLLTTITNSIVWARAANGAFITPQPLWEEFTGQPWEEHQQFKQPRRESSIAVGESIYIKSVPQIAGLSYQSIPGNGHCLFNAVGLYLGQTQEHLRETVAAYLESNLESLSGFIQLPTGKSIKNYIQDIRKGIEWASHVEIEILMRVLDRPIMIIGPNGNMTNPDDVQRFRGEPIFVYYNDKDHYDAYLLTGEVSAQNILQMLLKTTAQKNLSIIPSSSDTRHTFFNHPKSATAANASFEQLPLSVELFEKKINLLRTEQLPFIVRLTESELIIELPVDEPTRNLEDCQCALNYIKKLLAKNALVWEIQNKKIVDNRLVIKTEFPFQAQAIKTFLAEADFAEAFSKTTALSYQVIS